MSMNKLIFTILVGLAVYVDASGSDNFTLSQIEGEWKVLYVIYPPTGFHSSTCETFTITKRDGSNTKFDEDAISYFDGKWHSLKGHGTVENSIMTLYFPSIVPGSSDYSIKKFNNGNDIILFDAQRPFYSSLASRTTAASPAAKDEFGRMASRVGGKIIFIDQEHCSR